MSREQEVSENVSAGEGSSGPLAEARAWLQEGRPAEAADILKDLLEREPNNAEVYQELGVALFKLVRYGEAARASRRALQLDPTLHRPHGILAWIALNRGRYDEAEAELRAQLEAVPPDDLDRRASVHNQLGFLHFRQKRYDEAQEALRQALALSPGRAVPRLNLALLFLHTKQRDEARAELERVLALPEIPNEAAHITHLNLGRLYARQNRYAEAREQFARALKARRSFLVYLYRAVPFLARLPMSVLVAIVLIVVLIVWNFFLRG